MRRAAPHRCLAYDASDRKTFRSALCHLLQTEFPGVFGPSVTQLFAQRVEDLFDRFHPDRSRLRVGQVLWAAVAADDPPARNKRIEDTRLVPIVLDLVTAQDIDETTRRKKILRMFQQAYQQGAVLSYPDVSLLLHVQTSTISREVLDHERQTKEVIPRRGTIHDMGRSISHKAIICYKRLVEKKTTSQVAVETLHDPEEVEYYVQCLRRIKLCSEAGMEVEEISQATGHSKSLIQEYLDLIGQLRLSTNKNRPKPTPKTKTARPTARAK
jgi:hypothetical protein